MTARLGDRVRARIPVGHVRGIADAMEVEVESLEVLHPGGPIVRARPNTLDERARSALAHLERIDGPPAFRLTLTDARVAGDDPLVLTRRRIALAQSAFAREHLVANPVMNRPLPLPRRIDRAAILVGPWQTNHFHWVTDHLPRVEMLPLEEDPDLPVLVSGGLTETQRESLEMLGISRDRMLGYAHPHLRIKHAVWPSLAGRTGNTPRWAAEWLRGRLGHNLAQGTRMLYVERGNAAQRPVLHEARLIGALRALGIEPIRPAELSFREQMDVFSQASLIVGAHGAGLTNMVPARGATIVEIMDPRYVNGCFYALAEVLGHNYWNLFGEPQAGTAISVDLDLLSRTIEAAGATRRLDSEVR